MDERDLLPGSAPQDRAEVLGVQEDLRRLDHRLRIWWNPTSYVTCPGHFDVYGTPIAPHVDGRYEVGTFEHGVFNLIYQVRWENERGEPFRQVGPWLVRQFELWDRRNQHWLTDQLRMQREYELQVKGEQATADEALREGLARKAFALAGDHWNVPRRFGTPQQEHTHYEESER